MKVNYICLIILKKKTNTKGLFIMKKKETKLHLLENDVLSEVISISDMYDDDDSYFNDDDFINTYKDFNFIRKMSFLYAYITENDECKHNFDNISNDEIEQFIQKLQRYNINEEEKQNYINELRYIINNR